MTFREQVRFARVWGGAAFFSGLLGTLGLKLAFENSSERPSDLVVLTVAGLPLALGAAMLLFGGVVRPMQRWFYSYSRHSTLRMWGMTVRERFTQWYDARFWCWWLHIDHEGNDLDARN